jgi:hypothetical protein
MRRACAGPHLCRVADAQGVPLECRGRHTQHARRVHGCHDQDHMPTVLPPGAHSPPSPRAPRCSRAFAVMLRIVHAADVQSVGDGSWTCLGTLMSARAGQPLSRERWWSKFRSRSTKHGRS